MPWSVPERMRCVEISQPGGPEVLKPNPAYARTRPAGGADQSRRCRDQWPRRLPAARTHPAPPGVTDILGLEVFWHDRCARRSSRRMARRRRLLRTDGGRRLRRILHRARCAMLADPGRPRSGRCRRDAGELFHGLE